MKRFAPLDLRSAWLVLVSCLAVSLVVSAMAALNIALPEIAVDTSADTGQMTWIVDGYTLALAALLLPAGAIGDRFGRRGTLIVGLAIFGVASLLAVWITDPTMLIVSRCIAGAGAALIMPTTLSLITSGVPEDKRAFGISVWAAIAGIGAIAGMIFTGLLLEFFSWHSVFILFAASSLLAMALCLTIGTSKDRDPGRFDVLGSVTSILAVAGIVGGLLESPHRGWSDPFVLIGIVGGLILLGVFCVIEMRSASPLLDIKLFRSRSFSAGSVAVTIQFFASFALFFLMMQQLQLIFGYSPLKSALALFPLIIGVSICSLVGNWFASTYHQLRLVLVTGIAFGGAGLILQGTLDHTSYLTVGIALLVFSIGIGLASAPSTTAIMSNTPLDNQGVGSAVNDTAREIGAAIGIALAGSMMTVGYTSRIEPTATRADEALTAAGQAQIDAGNEAAGQMLLDNAPVAAEHIRRSLAEADAVTDRLGDQMGPLADELIEGAREAFTVPMNQAYIMLGAVMLAGAVLLIWLTPRRIVDTPVAGEAPLPDRVEGGAELEDTDLARD